MSSLEAGPSAVLAIGHASPTSGRRPTPPVVGTQVLQGLPDLDSDSDGDDDEGVFFGNFRPVEEKIITVLSAESAQTQHDDTVDTSLLPPRQASRPFKDFTRRKTILLSDDKENDVSAVNNSPEQSHPGCAEKDGQSPSAKGVDHASPFRLRTPLATRIRDNRFMSPRQTLADVTHLFTPSPVIPRARAAIINSPDVGSDVHASDLTLDFANFRLTDSPVPPVMSAPEVKKTKKSVGFARNVNVRWYSRQSEPPVCDTSDDEEDTPSAASYFSDSEGEDAQNVSSAEGDLNHVDSMDVSNGQEEEDGPEDFGPIEEEAPMTSEGSFGDDQDASLSDKDETGSRVSTQAEAAPEILESAAGDELDGASPSEEASSGEESTALELADGAEIDLGGLRLSDLSDPDEPFGVQYGDTEEGLGSESTFESSDEAGSPSSSGSPSQAVRASSQALDNEDEAESRSVSPSLCRSPKTGSKTVDVQHDEDKDGVSQAEQSRSANDFEDVQGEKVPEKVKHIASLDIDVSFKEGDGGSETENLEGERPTTPSNESIASAAREVRDDNAGLVMTDSPVSEADSETTPCPASAMPNCEISATHTPGTPTPLGELDSPMPVARGGPVIIPAMRFSPQAIPFFDDMPVDAEMESDMLGSNADIFAFEIEKRSPTSSGSGTPEGTHPPSIKSQHASLGLGATPSRVTPGRHVSAQMPDFALRGSKLLKSTALLNAGPPSPERPRVMPTAEDKAAALEVRSQLDRIARPAPAVSGAAATQRSTSASSTASSSSSASARAAARIPGRLGMGAPARSGSGSTRPEKGAILASRTKTASVAPNRALHKVASRTEVKPSIKPDMKPKSVIRPMTVSTAPRSRMMGPNFASSQVPPRPAPISSSVSRPPSALGKPAPTATGGAPRTALATKPVSQPSIASRPAAPVSTALKPQAVKPLGARVPLGNARTVPIVTSPVEVAANPLKRPFATMQPAPARTIAVAAGAAPARPTMGPPSRMFEPAVAAAAPSMPSLTAPVPANAGFSLGVSVPEAPWSASRGMFRSPGRAATRRTGGTPSKPAFLNLGTPSRRGEKPAPKPARGPAALLFPAAAKPTGATEVIAPSSTPPLGSSAENQASNIAIASPTRKNASGLSPPDAAAQRGSSADCEEVSFAIQQAGSSDQGSSPTPAHGEASSLPLPKQSTNSQDSQVSLDKTDRPGPSGAPGKIPSPTRPKRAVKPPQTLRGRVDLRETIVPNMSEKQLKAITAANTAKNEVYHCAIDRQIIRRTGPRPPSPGGRMRSSIDRDEDDQKKGRGDRAKKRAGEEVEEKPVIEVVTRPLGPGDEEAWTTPPRAAKKMRIGAEDVPTKSVRWDKGVVIVRDDGERLADLSELDPDKVGRGNLRNVAVQLDQHGNSAESTSSQDKLKKTKVLVTAVFYDGEEPVPVVAPSTATRSKKK